MNIEAAQFLKLGFEAACYLIRGINIYCKERKLLLQTDLLFPSLCILWILIFERIQTFFVKENVKVNEKLHSFLSIRSILKEHRGKFGLKLSHEERKIWVWKPSKWIFRQREAFKACILGRGRLTVWENTDQNQEYPSLGWNLLVFIKKRV